MKTDTIIQGDCIKKMRSFEAGCVDLAFADPPFNIGYDYDEYNDKRTCEDYLDWSREWMSQVKRVLKDDGTFWLAIGDEYAAELKVAATRELGLTCRSWVVWYYTFGVHCTSKFTRSHAHLFHFVKDPKRFTFNTDAIRVPSARQLVYADKRANPKGRVPDDTWIVPPRSSVDYDDRHGLLHAHDGWVLRPQDVPGGFSADSDTWYYPRVCGTFNERQGFHGCQMPEQVLGRIIKACSDEGDVVLDPFSGSGTTAAVAKKLGRKYVGIELSNDYAKQTRARLDGVRRSDSLNGPANALASVPPTHNGSRRGRRAGVASSQAKASTQLVGSESAAPSQIQGRDLDRGVSEAFRHVHRGYSSDWLLASRELYAEFISRCSTLGLPGGAGDWNRRLLALRKAKLLRGAHTTRRPNLDSEQLRACEYASEIALGELHSVLGLTLDRILCEPILACRFDELASRIAPGYSPEYYRWAAFGLRKKAKRARTFAAPFLALTRPVSIKTIDPIGSVSISQIPSRGGVYLLEGPCDVPGKGPLLYVGETPSLRDWVQMAMESSMFAKSPFRENGGESIVLRLAHKLVGGEHELLGLQSYMLGRRNSRWNYGKLASSAA